MKTILSSCLIILIVGCSVYEKEQKLIESLKADKASGNWIRAEKTCDQLISIAPKHADYYFQRGYVREMGKNYRGAIEDYTKVIELDPQKELARTNRGFAYRKLGQFEAAIQGFTDEMSINPNAYSYEYRGITRYEIGQYESALKDVDISIKMDAANLIAYKTRAKIYLALKRKEEASKDVSKAKELKIIEKYPSYKEEVLELEKGCEVQKD